MSDLGPPDELCPRCGAYILTDDRSEQKWAALRAERDALAKDAERYRWLRENATAVKAPGWHVVSETRHCLDAAIDAAMKEPQP